VSRRARSRKRDVKDSVNVISAAVSSSMQSKSQPNVAGFECAPHPAPNLEVPEFLCAVYAGVNAAHPKEFYHQVFDQVMVQLNSKFDTTVGEWVSGKSVKRGYTPAGEGVTVCDKVQEEASICVEVNWYEARPIPPTTV